MSFIATELPADVLLQADKPIFWSRSRVAGAVILIALAVFAFLGPVWVEADPLAQDYDAVLVPPGDAQHWLGTDQFGRSMLARLTHGARLSFVMALLTAASAAIPGIALGIVAAWRGGWVERLLVALSDVVLALPGLLLVLLLLAFAPGQFGPLYLGLALYLWVEFFRVARIEAARVFALPVIEATLRLGFGWRYLMRRLLLPALAAPMLTLFAFAMGSAVVAVSTLSAIHVGLRPPTPELGAIIVELMPYYREAPWQVLMPALAIFLLVLSLQLFAGVKPR